MRAGSVEQRERESDNNSQNREWEKRKEFAAWRAKNWGSS